MVIVEKLSIKDPWSWKTDFFRKVISDKIQAEVQKSGWQINKTSSEIESLIFQKVTTKEQYLVMVSMTILHIRKKGAEQVDNQINQIEQALQSQDLDSTLEQIIALYNYNLNSE